MDRRTFLAFTSSLTSMRASDALSAQPPSRIGILFDEYRRLSEAGQRHVCVQLDEDAELEELFYGRRDSVSGRIMEIPCASASDFAAKLIVDTCQGMLFSDWDTGRLWREARALVGAPDFMVRP